MTHETIHDKSHVVTNGEGQHAQILAATLYAITTGVMIESPPLKNLL